MKYKQLLKLFQDYSIKHPQQGTFYTNQGKDIIFYEIKDITYQVLDWENAVLRVFAFLDGTHIMYTKDCDDTIMTEQDVKIWFEKITKNISNFLTK